MVSDPNHSDSSYDYERLGFRAGLEIHAQIRSERKLFCHCKPQITPPGLKPDYVFERRFRPVLGEMGDYDAGMIIEYEKDYRVFYHTFPPPYDVCTYELDETPPFFPDQATIYAGFYLAHYYNCQSLVDEVIFNRKQYLDGSITTGFQRTAVLGKDGWIIVNGKKIRISNFNVEEDAARRVAFDDRTDRNVYFNLDRLSIPLVEIITNHEDCHNPKDLHDLALLLGLGLRTTGKGIRGIGSVRQDVNISIKRGDRVELKGVQDLKMLQTYVDREIQRQIALIEIMDELTKRGVQESDFEHFYIDVSASVDRFVYLEKEKGCDAFAIRLPKCADLFKREVQPGRSFGLELFDKAELISGLPVSQMFHSDDFSAWTKDQKAAEIFKEILGLQDGDSFIITIGSSNRAIHALKKIVERMKMALNGVPQETRRVLSNGNSEFLRVIHGKDRLYPDTDTQPIPIAPDRLERILSRYQPPKPWDLVETTDLSLIEVTLVVRHNLLFSFFINFTEKFAIPLRKAFGIVQNLHRLQKNVFTSSLDWEGIISQLIEWLESRKCSTQDIVPILEAFAIGWDAEQIIESISAQSEQLEVITNFIAENASKVWDNTDNVTRAAEDTNRAIRRMMHLIKNSFEDISSQHVAELVLEYWATWNALEDK